MSKKLIRRTNALARFNILPRDKYEGNDYDAYVERKEQERTALKRYVRA